MRLHIILQENYTNINNVRTHNVNNRMYIVTYRHTNIRVACKCKSCMCVNSCTHVHITVYCSSIV